ncbi:MAG: manganese efflux pump MntP family protein [Eubacteriales bacterium]
MNFMELTLLAFSLSMDAFAVAICRGLALKKCRIRDMLIIGLYFGGFQCMMPLMGYYIGSYFLSFIDMLDHIIPPIVLVFIGFNMIRSALNQEEETVEETSENLPKASIMLALALATSIDAFAVGVTFLPLQVHALSASSYIGVITFFCSALGIKIGKVFGMKYKSKAEFMGGLVLIIMGFRIFLQG